MDEITQILHEALLAVREAATAADRPEWFRENAGICTNVDSFSDLGERKRLLETLCSLTKAWPDKTYNHPYPVGGFGEYYLSRNLWGNLRRLKLLDWLIAETAPERSTKQKEPMTNDEYLAAGGEICPACRSKNISHTDNDNEGSYHWFHTRCYDCGARWTELLQLTGYVDLETEK